MKIKKEIMVIVAKQRAPLLVVKPFVICIFVASVCESVALRCRQVSQLRDECGGI